MSRRLFRGLNAQWWEQSLMRGGWPKRAAFVMARGLTGDRPFPDWSELLMGLDAEERQEHESEEERRS